MTSLEVLSQIKVAPQRPQKWNHGSGKEGAGQGKGNQGNHYTKARCGHSQSRVADLTRHLQSQHGIHFRAADKMVALIEEFGPACICNPSRERQPKGHKCMAWRQIGMLIHHLNPRKWALILPWTISDSMVSRLTQLNPLLYSEAPWLPPQMVNGNLHLIWTTPSTCTGLSHHCTICKFSGTPETLWHHMTTGPQAPVCHVAQPAQAFGGKCQSSD